MDAFGGNATSKERAKAMKCPYSAITGTLHFQ
jgi:hypothetical protein